MPCSEGATWCRLILISRYRWNMPVLHQTELPQCSGWHRTKCETDALHTEKPDLCTTHQLHSSGELKCDQENYLHYPWLSADRLPSSVDGGVGTEFAQCTRDERGGCWLESRSDDCDIHPRLWQDPKSSSDFEGIYRSDVGKIDTSFMTLAACLEA